MRRRTARATLAAFAALLAAAACGPLPAAPLVRLDVVDRDSGEWLSPHRHRGEDWIAGTPGNRYGVRLTNTSGERVLVVLSVDGVNAVTGETAHPSQAGYVLAPWQSTEITGWRKSYADVAQFVFTDLGDSYAARTGRPRNVGTIGVAVFRERRHAPRPMPAPPIARGESRGGDHDRAARAPVPSSANADVAAEASAQSIGTGHGAREWSPVSQTAFERAGRTPAQVSQLRYDEVGRLVALGIVPPRWRERHWPEPRWAERGPQAFPGGFVPDPR